MTPIQTATNTAAQGDQGRERSRRHRDHPERENRLRRQRRLGHRDPDQTATNRPARRSRSGPARYAIAITPNGKTAYVVELPSSGTRDPDQHRHQQGAQPIKVGIRPVAIAITPNGKTAYVVNGASRAR